ncbi:hypothetical protein BJ878DRAFT_489585 [Calycina marina]|uniref:Uncharacterized protein n=1 Tax=Calycina marina TaxID=1763456 RepID=A0A9P8CK17_9HELO|nr:hypothetical protein BJ878DRAFT_489585 [Calycina marina]
MCLVGDDFVGPEIVNTFVAMLPAICLTLPPILCRYNLLGEHAFEPPTTFGMFAELTLKLAFPTWQFELLNDDFVGLFSERISIFIDKHLVTFENFQALPSCFDIPRPSCRVIDFEVAADSSRRLRRTILVKFAIEITSFWCRSGAYSFRLWRRCNTQILTR